MLRRSVIAIAGGVTLGVAPMVLGQSEAKVRRIGVLSLYVRRDVFLVLPALRQLGYDEPRNVTFDYRFADGKDDQLAPLAADLVAKKVDLILAVTSSEAQAARRATTTIPIIVAAAGADPVEVASLAHPGANITGVTGQPPEVNGKIFQLLRDTVGRLTRVAGLREADRPNLEPYVRASRRAAVAMGFELQSHPIGNLADLDTAFTTISRNRPDALNVGSSGILFSQRARVIEFAAQQKLPAIYGNRLSVTEGGLMSYSSDNNASAQRVAAMVDNVLKGAKPADIPVEMPAKYNLVINLKTAKALGFPTMTCSACCAQGRGHRAGRPRFSAAAAPY